MLRVVLIICVSILSILTDVAQAQMRPLPEGMTLHKKALAWDEAHADCKAKGAVLASPINDHSLKAMRSWMGVKNTLYFIGIRSWYPEPFVSVEGVPIESITVAAIDMIDALDQRNGDCLAMDRDSIRVVPCWSRLPYMCYDTNIFNTTASVPRIDVVVPSVSMTNCGSDEEGYKYNASTQKCYKAPKEMISWIQAEHKCITEGGHLVVVDNANEAQVIRDIILSRPGWEWISTGIYDSTYKSDWISIHGQRVEDLYNVWDTGYKGIDKNYPCGIFSYEKAISTTGCIIEYNYICERAPTA